VTASMGKGSSCSSFPTGGEPFLRKDIGEIVKIFHKNTGVRNVGIPTNAARRARTVSIVKDLCESCPEASTCTSDISLDGVGPLHDEIRVFPGLFKRSGRDLQRRSGTSRSTTRLQRAGGDDRLKHNEDVLIENYEWFRRTSTSTRSSRC